MGHGSIIRLAILAAMAPLLPGCVQTDLGTLPLLCHYGEPRCPSGYVCTRHLVYGEVCLKEGEPLPDLYVPGPDEAGVDMREASTPDTYLEAGADASPDGGVDASPDGGVDASPDGGVDASPDGPKLTPDGGVDASPDGPKLTPDSGADASPDAPKLTPDSSVDASSPDGPKLTPDGGADASPDAQASAPDVLKDLTPTPDNDS